MRARVWYVAATRGGYAGYQVCCCAVRRLSRRPPLRAVCSCVPTPWTTGWSLLHAKPVIALSFTFQWPANDPTTCAPPPPVATCRRTRCCSTTPSCTTSGTVTWRPRTSRWAAAGGLAWGQGGRRARQCGPPQTVLPLRNKATTACCQSALGLAETTVQALCPLRPTVWKACARGCRRPGTQATLMSYHPCLYPG